MKQKDKIEERKKEKNHERVIQKQRVDIHDYII